MATLPGAWRFRVSTGTGQPGVSVLWLGEVESLICNFYLSVAACTIVIIIITIIALKGAIWYFSQSPHRAASWGTLKWPGCNSVQITCITWRAYHMHHMDSLSHGELITCITWRADHMHHMESLSHGELITCITWRAYHMHHMESLSHGELITCITWRADHMQPVMLRATW